jgi:8-oxo-dGTP pyrophosphatase MutT (NUDIX family)
VYSNQDLKADEEFRSRCRANLAGFPVAALDPRDGLRRSAVAVCVVAGPDGEACVVVTRRTRGLRAHPGQLALPGGRIEAGEDAEAAALRETREEVGLSCSPGDVLGRLDDFISRSGHHITPVVVWGPPQVDLVAGESEVASVHLVPVADLDHPEAPRLLTIPESDRPVIQMPVLGFWIHAPTAAVLYQFREVVVHGRHTRVAHFEQPTWAWR